MKLIQIKLYVIAVITLPIFAVAVFKTDEVHAVYSRQDDAATTYKTKCQVCHTPKAEKFFDPAKTDEVLAEIIMKGKKGEKPPFMPGYEAKGMTAEQAMDLVVLMKKLRTPSSP